METWLVGLCERKLNPPLNYPMAGYVLRDELSSGTHDDLFVRAVSFRLADKRVIIVECDLLGIRKDWADDVASKLCKSFNIDDGNIFLCCTHTHSAPDSLGRYERGDAFDKWMCSLENEITLCVSDAIKNEAPAELSVSVGYPGVQVNRVVSANWGGNNKQSWETKNWDERPLEEVKSYERKLREIQNSGKNFLDDEIVTLRIWDPADKKRTRGVLVNYGCHPVTLGPDNSLYSADYPGTMRKALLDQWPGTMIMFLNGCCGDINPVSRGDFSNTDFVGKKLAESVINGIIDKETALNAYLHIEKYPLHIKNEIEYDEESLSRRKALYLRGLQEAIRKGLHEECKIYSVYLAWAEKMLSFIKSGLLEREMACEMSVLELGSLRMVLFPFEVFSGIGRAIKDKLRKECMVVAYAGGDYGYLISEELYDIAKYERQESYKFMCIPGPAEYNAQKVIMAALDDIQKDSC